MNDPIITARGVYDGSAVTLTEPVSVKGKYEVSVAFLKPAEQKLPKDEKAESFKIEKIAESLAQAESLSHILPPRNIPIEDRAKRIGALQRIAGIVAGNPMTIDEIKTSRLARQ